MASALIVVIEWEKAKQVYADEHLLLPGRLRVSSDEVMDRLNKIESLGISNRRGDHREDETASKASLFSQQAKTMLQDVRGLAGVPYPRSLV